MNSTDWLMIVTVAVWIVYDIFIAVKKGGMATISVRIYELSKAYPAIPFAVGCLIGHLFLGMFLDCKK